MRNYPNEENVREAEGFISDIQRFSLHDGPGIRTVVFLKGCSLSCQWCSNPELIDARPQLGLIKSICNKCYKCIEVCASRALYCDEGLVSLDGRLCTNCGKCVPICFPKALVVYGRKMTVKEVLKEVQRDAIFYHGSGGGVTFSGGEPLFQPSFTLALLKKCREDGIHAAIETSGNVKPNIFGQALLLTDFMLFDLKCMDAIKHEEFTKRSNRLILENAKTVGRSEVSVLFRMPLIPGVNDDPYNIQQTARFLKTMKRDAHRIELLPYHRFGKAKYVSLDKPCAMEGTPLQEPCEIERVRYSFEQLGILCTISH